MTQNTSSREPGSQASDRPRPSEGGREHTNLDRRYGEIGILAVAAAVRYQGGKDPASAPVAAEVEDRFVEVAA
jgi:hypothetical protein